MLKHVDMHNSFVIEDEANEYPLRARFELASVMHPVEVQPVGNVGTT